MKKTDALARRLGLADAVMIGLGSMIGAGIFAAFTPAAAAAGSGVLVGLAIAAGVAFCNATSSAQLAAQFPTSGGTYVYGRERLGEWPGFVAGWSFVIGKTASCAAMALTVAAYAAPTGWEKPVAVAAVLLLAAVNLFGVTRTARLTKAIVVVVLLVLLVVILIGAQSATMGTAPGRGLDGVLERGWYGILQAAGLLFFAFAGYARIATMGEEVKDPARAIPRAIVIALSTVLLLYAVVAVLLLLTLGAEELAAAPAPLMDLIRSAGASWAVPIVQIGAVAASLGALLALMAGVGRTTLAMARNDDVPRWLGSVHPKTRVPHRAEITLALAVCALVVAVDLRQAIGFSSFGVLLYYLVANVAAHTQDRPHRRYPRAVQVLGALGCATLVATVPVVSVIGGLTVLTGGVVYRSIRLRATRRRE